MGTPVNRRAVLSLHGAAADIDGRAGDAVDAEKFEGQAGADDIGDRIGRADFVKVDLFDGDLVDGGLGFAQLLENGERVFRGAGREGGLLDDFDDVGEVPVSVLMLHRDVEFGGADTAALYLLEGDGGADFEGCDGGGDGGLVGAGVGQRADKHVAADAGEGVQVTGQRHVSFMVAQAPGVMRKLGLAGAFETRRLCLKHKAPLPIGRGSLFSTRSQPRPQGSGALRLQR
jgi:hypothetical protein